MQRKQKQANAKKADRIANVAPRQYPAMVTRVELVRIVDGRRSLDGIGIIHYPPRFAR